MTLRNKPAPEGDTAGTGSLVLDVDARGFTFQYFSNDARQKRGFFGHCRALWASRVEDGEEDWKLWCGELGVVLSVMRGR